MNYLIIGLGNIGPEYKYTRHNIGFLALDTLASQENVSFQLETLAYTSSYKHKGRTVYMIKPTTYMNLSGKAVRSYMKKYNIPLEHILVITDDIALPFSTIRLKGKGSHGGHNGLKSIQELLLTPEYARLRVGIGNDFHPGQQANYVLGKWNEQEVAELPAILEELPKIVNSFCAIGLERTMNLFNGKKTQK